MVSNKEIKQHLVVTARPGYHGNVPNKKSHTFIAFDISDFHPSITEELADNALDLASHYIEITTEERMIIKHTKKTTVSCTNMPWRKIRSVFDVKNDSFDGVETCELVGLFLLSQLTHLDVNVGLYRDGGLATCAKTPKQVKAIKKEMCKIFKHNNLQITIEANKKRFRLCRHHLGFENSHL